jgi:Fic family protein
LRIEEFTKAAPGNLVPSRIQERYGREGREIPASVEVQAFVPDNLPPAAGMDEVVRQVLHELLEAQTQLSRLEGRAKGVVQPRLLMAPFWRREARLSSLIEDTVTTPEQVAIAEASLRAEDAETREVLNYIRALGHGLRSPLPICNRLIRELHSELLSGVRGERDLPGEFRREQNYIGNSALGIREARFVPPPAGMVLEECMQALEQFFNRTNHNLPALIAIALAHYQFECIHPFRDGNGRIGRLLIVLSLCREGILSQPWIYISAYLEREKQVYKDLLLRVSTHADWTSWLRFMLKGFAISASDASAKVERLLELREEFRARLTKPRSSALSVRLIDQLFEKPAIRVRQAVELLGVTQTAVRRHLAHLVELGILHEVDVSRKEKLWLSRKIIEVSEAES